MLGSHFIDMSDDPQESNLAKVPYRVSDRAKARIPISAFEYSLNNLVIKIIFL